MSSKVIFPAWLAAALLAVSCSGNNTPEGTGRVAVKTVKVSSGIQEGTAYSGTIEETTGTALSFSGTGTIATMGLREGQMVSKGQVLATLDGKNQENILISAKSSTAIARESLSQMEDMYSRMKILHDAGSLSEMQWIEAETRLAQAKAAVEAAEAQEAIAGKGQADTRLTAPFGGFVSKKMADVGQQVLPGTPVVKLVDIDRVKAKFSISESEVGTVAVGQKMSVRVGTLSDASFEGTVTDKSVSADPVSRSYDVSVLIDNKDHRLLPGMLCEVSAAPREGGGEIAVPSQVVLIDETNSPYVWCVDGGKATKKHVTLGRNAGEDVVIASGLKEGDSVITEGRQKVWEGAECQIL